MGTKDYPKTWVAELEGMGYCCMCQAQIRQGDLAILSMIDMRMACLNCRDRFIKTGNMNVETVFRTVEVNYGEEAI